MARRKKAEKATEAVRLRAPHEHRGILYPPDVRLDGLTPGQAKRLYDRGKAVPASPVVPESFCTSGESESPSDDGETPPDGE